MWLWFFLGSTVGGAIAAFLVRRHAVRAREAAVAQVTAQLDAAGAECARLRAEQQALLGALTGELGSLDGALAATPDAAQPRTDVRARRGDQARAQLALVSRGSEALEQFVAGVLYRGEEATRSAEEARRVAGEAAEHAERVERASALLAALGREFDAVRDTMQGLARAGSQIGSFVETIEGIASQTNLLALNAAIEAARAGAHGRGFAVVADEVRKLAEDASRAARQVSESVQSIREAIDRVGTVVGSADSGLAEVREVTVDAQRALAGVVEGLGRTVAFVEQVAGSVGGESSALDGLLSDMGEMHEQASTALADATQSAEEGAARDEALARAVDVAGRVRVVTTRFAAGVGG